MTYSIFTTDSEATQKLGEMIGRQIRPGTSVELIGDLGSGKTTLTQGIAAGLGVKGEVPSPTFTMSRVYPARDGIKLHHFDWYRLSDFDPVTSQFAEAAADPKAVAIIEWPGNVGVKLPSKRLRITMEPSPDVPTGRNIKIESLAGAADALVESLKKSDKEE